MNGLTVKTSLSSLKGILDSQQEPKILILQHGTMHQTNTLERLQKEFMASRSILQQKPTTGAAATPATTATARTTTATVSKWL